MLAKRTHSHTKKQTDRLKDSPAQKGLTHKLPLSLDMRELKFDPEAVDDSDEVDDSESDASDDSTSLTSELLDEVSSRILPRFAGTARAVRARFFTTFFFTGGGARPGAERHTPSST